MHGIKEIIVQESRSHVGTSDRARCLDLPAVIALPTLQFE